MYIYMCCVCVCMCVRVCVYVQRLFGNSCNETYDLWLHIYGTKELNQKSAEQAK